MSRDWLLYRDDLVSSGRKIIRYTEGMSKNDFLRDSRTFDAVLRNLEVIGEAARHLSQAEQAGSLSVDWPRIISFRNIIAHEYFGIDEDIVWDIVVHKVPELLASLQPLLDAPE